MSAGTCDFCLRPIIWATTVYERKIPLDPDPDPDGNQAAYRDETGALRTRHLKKGQQAQAFEKLYMPHVATCAARQKAPALPANVIPISRPRRP